MEVASLAHPRRRISKEVCDLLGPPEAPLGAERSDRPSHGGVEFIASAPHNL